MNKKDITKLSGQEIQEMIDTLKSLEGDDSLGEKILKKNADTIKALEAELQSRGKGQPTPQNQPAPVSAPMSDDTLNKVLTSLMTLAETTGSGGMDASGVISAIKNYLDKNKVQYSQISKEVIDEIKKRQQIELKLPNLSAPIVITSQDASIPYIYEIIDDVLSGNNVYLIGDAGSGKTYTAEKVASLLNRDFVMINCSQYTSPVEIIGGQTIEGYKDGKLIIAWQKGKVLIVDEMPKIDPNTAGLFNDAFAKSSKTKEDSKTFISSAKPDQPPIPRHKNFAVIATGNVYPNTTDPAGYVANNQQDLSLLDRFSGNVYYIDYAQSVDAEMCIYQFIYDMLVGNWYDWNAAKQKNQTPPEPKGLRACVKDLMYDKFALVSYRTITSLRVAFEIELARAIAHHAGDTTQLPPEAGKTFLKAFNNYLVAFTKDQRETLRNKTGFKDAFIKQQVQECISQILVGGVEGLKNVVHESLKASVSDIYSRYETLEYAQVIK